MATVLTKRGDPEGSPVDEPLCYVVTDIETDGPEPGRNSMRSFACVAIDQNGARLDQFERSLEPVEGSVPDPETLAWLQSQPEVWADATRDPQPPEKVMQDYAAWLRALPAVAVFVANPLAFDGFWMDWYLRRFLGLRLVCGPYGGERLFLGTGLDLPSLVMGSMGWHYNRCRREHYPEHWLGGKAHTHRAIDDAEGYASVLVELLREKNAGVDQPLRPNAS